MVPTKKLLSLYLHAGAPALSWCWFKGDPELKGTGGMNFSEGLPGLAEWPALLVLQGLC